MPRTFFITDTMSEKTKFPHAEALKVAQAIVEKLRPFVERIAIAGSLRRCKPYVSDIEILFVPRMENVPDGFFFTKEEDISAREIERLVAAGEIEKRANEAGSFTWGALNKLGRHVPSGIPVDFFCEPDPLDWWRSLVIRTGPKDFNIRLMATAPRHGYTAHAYGEALHRIPGGERVIAKDERDFIELCGLEWQEPKNRF